LFILHTHPTSPSTLRARTHTVPLTRHCSLRSKARADSTDSMESTGFREESVWRRPKRVRKGSTSFLHEDMPKGEVLANLMTRPPKRHFYWFNVDSTRQYNWSLCGWFFQQFLYYFDLILCCFNHEKAVFSLFEQYRGQARAAITDSPHTSTDPPSLPHTHSIPVDDDYNTAWDVLVYGKLRWNCIAKTKERLARVRDLTSWDQLKKYKVGSSNLVVISFFFYLFNIISTSFPKF
jgi:hypothetical protein